MNTTYLPDFNSFLAILVEKWREVPGSTQERVYSASFLDRPDGEFHAAWQALYDNNCAGQGYTVRGWYHDLYTPLAAQGGRWLDVGSGMGYDGVYFARCGARVTFLDIVADNLRIIERVCSQEGITGVDFKLMDSMESLSALGQFDNILAVGSLINAPYELMCAERSSLASHLATGGRWLELCYPKERWAREGALPFSQWGKRTDGERTPWVEWYDEPKLRATLAPHNFDTILATNFHDDDFNWFDLVKRS
jgi:SAM-dependent methyltransferase